ncbi:AAA family ATPase [Roseovarius dicentrarchi]|uniref:bifunctional aminoglycoside phosphotransferase/ATP-binding protein n=1 Tax=Roseovarius dicentrarchi TaxID=2250573 RepID=UPI000DEA6E77|nr:bifunctional aminoglycoside phosphotransferase/ATP-binding protein [Roseovarius dicentrarchi]
MANDAQAEVIAFLSRQMEVADRAAPQIVRTHGAVLLLGRRDAWKIKRAVRYAYLDFSTATKRHDMLLRELELNRPAAPSIYRDLVAVTRDAGGQLHMGGTGAPAEWVLRMRRFDTADELVQIAARGALDADIAADLGKVIAQYHAAAPVRSQVQGADLIGALLDQLNTAFADMTDVFGTDAVDHYRSAADHAWRGVRAQLNARGAAGHVRRCHGDLHLGNIVMQDGVPTLFDALEFDETLGTSDVLYDLAFLLMDLAHNGQMAAANAVLNAYLFHAGDADHYAALSLLPLFQSLRAAIRAMVAVQAERAGGNGGVQAARDYLARAQGYLSPPPARLIAVGGRSGTGKSVLAAAIAPHIGAAPGAVHLRSDLERKALFGAAPLAPLPASAYTEDVSARVYDTMLGKARMALLAGHGAIVDATWLDKDARAALDSPAPSAPFTGLWLAADTATLEARVTARQGDASDADAAVLRRQTDRQGAPKNWLRIDATGSRADTFAQALCALGVPRRAPLDDKG